MLVNKEMIERVAEELSPFADDVDCFWDTLDGETDVMELVGTLLENITKADSDNDAILLLIEKYHDRGKLIRNRRDKLKSTLKNILVATGQKKIPHALATVSMRKGGQSVRIVNDEEIPSQLCKVVKIPDKTAIKNQLLAGENVDGAILFETPETISIRMK
tara:strand:- start:576 stop:1058 length:483 start_codon:yes stop_codon:yes gene_type:complete